MNGHAAPRPQRPDAVPEQLVLGLLLGATGLVWLLDRLDALEASWAVVLPAGLLLVGLALIALARDPAEHAGLVTLGVVLSAVTLVTQTAPAFQGLPLAAGVGDRIQRITTLDELDDPDELQLSIGSLELDLSELVLAPAGSRAAEVPVLEAAVGKGGARRAAAEGRRRPGARRRRHGRGADARHTGGRLRGGGRRADAGLRVRRPAVGAPPARRHGGIGGALMSEQRTARSRGTIRLGGHFQPGRLMAGILYALVGALFLLEELSGWSWSATDVLEVASWAVPIALIVVGAGVAIGGLRDAGD